MRRHVTSLLRVLGKAESMWTENNRFYYENSKDMFQNKLRTSWYERPGIFGSEICRRMLPRNKSVGILSGKYALDFGGCHIHWNHISIVDVYCICTANSTKSTQVSHLTILPTHSWIYKVTIDKILRLSLQNFWTKSDWKGSKLVSTFSHSKQQCPTLTRMPIHVHALSIFQAYHSPKWPKKNIYWDFITLSGVMHRWSGLT